MELFPAQSPLWRHVPWLLGLALAPFLFGSTTAAGQAVVGLLLATSFFLLALDAERVPSDKYLQSWRWLALVCLLVPLAPLPFGVVELLSPQRAKFALNFAVEESATHGWLPLTISPARTIQRLWELSLLLTCFWLARRAGRHARMPRFFAVVVAMALLLEALTGFWFRLEKPGLIFGVWQISWGNGFGTFANRNHFADWVGLGVLFSLGGILRQVRPLPFAQVQSLWPAPRRLPELLLCLAAVLVGIVMAAASRSRGGFVVLMTGLLIWGVLLTRRSHRRARWLLVGAGLLLAGLIILGSSSSLRQRLTETKFNRVTHSAKIEAWKQTAILVPKYWLFGTGWGTFATAVNHYKTSTGLETFLHAENDYLQSLLEAGILGALVFGGLLFFLAHRFVRSTLSREARLAEPELAFGALAALAGFTVHALFEFVFQITANALFAAALFGFVAGCSDPKDSEAAPPRVKLPRRLLRYGWAIVLFALAALQGLACYQFEKGLQHSSPISAAQHFTQSLRLWPWASQRQIALTRVHVLQLSEQPRADQLRKAAVVREQLNHRLAGDPFNWELRLERVWLDLAFSTNSARAVAEAREAMRLNPLQPQTSLRFARHFAHGDPDLAWEFVRSGYPHRPPLLREALSIAWQATHDTAALWSLTPDTAEDLLGLGDFALEIKLFPLAALAYQGLTNRWDSLPLAERFLRAQRPDLTLSLLPVPPTNHTAKLLTAKAHLQLENFDTAIRHAQSVWSASRLRDQVLTPTPAEESLDKALAAARAQIHNLPLALRLVETISKLPAAARDRAQLREISQRFPREPRLLWLIFQTELELNHSREAALAAVELASVVAALE